MTAHEVSVDGDVVRKVYGRTDRGEPWREWDALVLLHELAPGLAPVPLARETEPAAVLMSRLPGVHLDSVLTPTTTAAFLAAYRLLFSLPVPEGTPLRHWHPAAFLREVGTWVQREAGRDDLAPVESRALDAARGWHAAPPPGLEVVRDPVLAQGDGKVENTLWDGERVRLVDFEGFGVGDLAFEVADLAEHVSARLPGLRDPDVVIAGFDLDATQHERAEYYRVTLATFWLLQLLPGNRGHARNPEGSSVRQAEHLLRLLEAR